VIYKNLIDKQQNKGELYKQGQKLIYSVSHEIYKKIKHTDSTITLNDLMCTAFLELDNIINRYKPETKIKFRTFARYRIKGSMIDYIRSQDSVSRNKREGINKLEKLLIEFHKNKTDKNKIDYLMEKTGFTEGKIKQLLSSDANETLIYFSDLNDSIQTELEQSQATQEDILFRKERLNIILEAIEKSKLNDKERQVIIDTYWREKDLGEIAKSLDVTTGRVCQLRNEAGKKIGQYLTHNRLKDEIV